MLLTHLSLTNFRNFARLDLDLPGRAIVLVGSNAQGKTSLLEAVYFLAAFTSFQTHVDRQMVNFLAAREPLAVARLVAEYQRSGMKHKLEVRLILEPNGVTGQRLRKEVLLDGLKRPMAEVIGHFNAVVFVPQMSLIIEGGPDERRRYLNLALAQASTSYAQRLSEYAQVVTQRNALLKQLQERNGDPGQLSFWDASLSQLGAQIMFERIQALQDLERLAARIHQQLTRSSEVLRLNYQPSFEPLPRPQGQISLPMQTQLDRSKLDVEEIRTRFLKRLGDVRAEEISRGVTTLGPHRDELRLLANTIDLGDYGSRGQGRTALLALKLAEVEWMHERTDQWPVILLDEVLAELDVQRRSDLLDHLDQCEQTLLTTTDLALYKPGFVSKATCWQVSQGQVQDLSVQGDGHDG